MGVADVAAVIVERFSFGPVLAHERSQRRIAGGAESVVYVGEQAVMVILGVVRLDEFQQLVPVEPVVQLRAQRDDLAAPFDQHAVLRLAVPGAVELLEALPLEPDAVGLGGARGRVEIGPNHLRLAGPERRARLDQIPEMFVHGQTVSYIAVYPASTKKSAPEVKVESSLAR